MLKTVKNIFIGIEEKIFPCTARVERLATQNRQAVDETITAAESHKKKINDRPSESIPMAF